jgi:hypothetical protein
MVGLCENHVWTFSVKLFALDEGSGLGLRLRILF